MINPQGALVSRADLMRILGGATAPYLSATYETQMVRDLGGVVFTSGIENVVFNDKSSPHMTQHRRITQIWKRVGSGWQLTFRHSSLIAKP
jgi:ketosteroid isomerase-like protein